MNVLSYVKTMDGCSYHRIYNPNQYIDANVRVVSDLNDEHLQWCDIFHYSRHSKMSPEFFNKKRKEFGFKIIVDTDDGFEVNKDHPQRELWEISNLSLSVMQHLANADAVTCTTEILKNRLLGINNNVYVIPNCLPYGEGQFKYVEQEKSDRVRLLYASTIMNYSNTDLIGRAMKKLAHLPIEIVIAGFHETKFYDRVIQNLTAGVIPYKTIDWKASSDYMESYIGDIGILPSKASTFNAHKSNLKVLEYAALKLPVVVSNCEPYLNMPVNYFTGEKSFIEQVTRLVEDEKYRKECGERLHDFCVVNYSMDVWSKKRLEIYNKILNDSRE